MKEEIRKYITNYFEGCSTLEEEKALRAYFTSNDVDEELLEYQPLFSLYQQEQEVKMPADMEIILSGGKPYRPHHYRFRNWKMYAAGIAASFVLIISLYFIFNPPTHELLCENYVVVNGETICDIDIVNQYTDDVMNKIDELLNESDKILEEQGKMMKEFNISDL